MELRQKTALLKGNEIVVVDEGKGGSLVLTREAAWWRAQEMSQVLLRREQVIVDEFLVERRRELELDR